MHIILIKLDPIFFSDLVFTVCDLSTDLKIERTEFNLQ